MSLFRKMAFEQRHELSESMRYLGDENQQIE